MMLATYVATASEMWDGNTFSRRGNAFLTAGLGLMHVYDITTELY